MTSPVPSNRRRAFTLVELLAVIAIIGIMIAVMMPSMIGMARGSKLSGTVSQLKTTMTLARQWAITKRERVYVLFPNEKATLYGGDNTSQVHRAWRSYAVYGERSGYLREWTQLPEGIVFVGTEGEFNSGNPEGPDDVDNPMIDSNAAKWPSLPFPSNSSPRVNLPAFIFKPDGRAVDVGSTPNGSEVEIYLSEGFVETDLPGAPSKPKYKGPDGKRPFFGCQVYTGTGRMRLRDYKDLGK